MTRIERIFSLPEAAKNDPRFARVLELNTRAELADFAWRQARAKAEEAYDVEFAYQRSQGATPAQCNTAANAKTVELDDLDAELGVQGTIAGGVANSAIYELEREYNK